VRLAITGEPGRNWTIQASSDLTQWIPLAQITNTCDEIEFTDVDSKNLGQRFYRVRVGDP
jgi:hypothetical protein